MSSHIATKIATKIPPPIIALLVAGLMVLSTKLITPLAVPGALRWAAVGVFFGLGLAIELVAIWTFRRAKTTINPLNPKASSQLVTMGVYQYSRNPMYVGLCCQLLAVVCFLAAPQALLGLPLFVFLINNLQIIPEETALLQSFGQPYQDYLQQVRRWL